ncbi:MAG: glycerol-3-phosphate acyltransferase, partial [Clostridiales bacterium]|nr:glycerol-3-phosphate acyltransferase [Clostridiales bacterium]
MIVSRVIGLVLGYIFGLFPTGKLVGKAYNTDLRKEGSGNTGMTNSIRVLGRKAGVIVFF